MTDCRLRNHSDSVVVALKTGGFTEKEIELANDIKIVLCTVVLLTDLIYILVKEKPSPTHSTASRQLDVIVAEAVV